MNIESIELLLLNREAPSTVDATNATQSSLPPPSQPLPTQAIRLLRLGSALVATVKLDYSQRATLRGIEANLDVPNLVVSVDIHSAKCLCNLITAYLAITAAEPSKSNSKSTVEAVTTKHTSMNEGEIVNTKSIMQRVLMSDPTLRTLFWLEEEENRKKKTAVAKGKYCD